MKLPHMGRDATTHGLLEHRLILGIVTVCSIMVMLMFGSKFGGYFTSLERILP